MALSYRTPPRRGRFPQIRAGRSRVPERLQKAHDVVAAVYVDHFTGNVGAEVAGEEESGFADFFGFHVALQGRAFGVVGKRVAEPEMPPAARSA
jgi:hypothetical protein